MARESKNNNLPPVTEAYQQWIAKCLIADGSILSSGTLWTPEYVEEVRKAFVDHPDSGSDSFWYKLKNQIKDASPSAKQLMAEMLWALLVFPVNINAETKRDKLREVWSYSGQVLSENLPQLGGDVLDGIGSGGQGYLTGYWRELTFLIELVVDLKKRNQTDRQKLFSSYDDFVAWIQKIPGGDTRQFRHMLRYVAFPDRVERIASNNDRLVILEQFGIAPKKQARKWSDREVDDALFKLRTKCQAEYPGEILDFYEPPLKTKWRPEEELKSVEPIETPVTAAQLGQPEPFTKADALAGLFMSPDELDTILARLKRKKALILQGPPGVGKTFIARRLAFALMGKQDTRRVKMIQFHPSYGYEDFVQGFRPTRTGLERRDGVFHQFAQLARNDPNRDWFFIIDEINRGNLAKIFGELLMLIEADKRGPDHAIPLTYSEGPDETFQLPPNLHLIGTMNTADRSLAMVDYALRRRFSFVTLNPALDSPGFAAWLKERNASDTLIARIRAKVGNLNEIIENERDLGPGFRIGHSFFCPPHDHSPDEAWYREIIAGEIQPLLEEYFDSREKVENLVAELLA